MLPSVTLDSVELPSQAPVMFLPGVVLLPHVLLPLYIFEPRYRAMLTHALEEQRMFCVALMRPGVDEVRGASDFFPTCGLGLVRACVGRGDGTSHLILQGVARVELGVFTQDQPFRIATVRPLTETLGDPAACERLAEQVRHLCIEICPPNIETREKLEEQFGKTRDPAALADIVAQTFLRDPQHQQEVLDELEVEARLRLVQRHLREENTL